MSISDKFERLRNFPEVTRRRILVATTFSITGLVFLFWLTVRLYDFGSVNETRVETKGPINEVGEVLGGFIESVSDRVSQFGEILYQSTTTSATNTEETAL